MHATHLIAVPALFAALSLAGCQNAPSTSPKQAGNEANGPSPNAAAPLSPAPDKPAAVSITSKDDGLEFDYGWPSEAAAIAPLDTWLRGNAADARKKATAMALDDQKSARSSGYPFHNHSFIQHWTTAADIPALLVLTADGYTFTGGAHGMPFISTIIWDKTAQTRLAISALLDVPLLAKTINPRFCEALDAQRAEKRGAPVDPNNKDGIPEFNRCVDMTKQEIIPISKGGKAFDTIRVVILPYEAGPYAEGSYTIDLPLDDAARAAVKPAWRSAFVAH